MSDVDDWCGIIERVNQIETPSLEQQVAALEAQLVAYKSASDASIRGLAERVGMLESGQRYKLVLREEKP